MSTYEAWRPILEPSQGFKYHDKLPFANYTAIVTAASLYLVTIFGIRQFMKNRKRVELKGIVVFHNFFLCAWSFAMLVGLGYEMVKIATAAAAEGKGLTLSLLCDPEKVMSSGMVEWWFFIFYISKFYELLDTVIIVLKKNPIIFLHVYHHCITILLVYVMIEYRVAVRWLATMTNVTVHVPMYYYYAISSMGKTVWWKKYITKMQIAQFVLDIVANCVGFYYISTGESCSGSLPSWIFGQAILVSFLILFMMFYQSTYKKPQPGTAAAPAGAKKQQ